MEDPKLSLTLMFPSGKLLKYLKFMIQIFEIAAECRVGIYYIRTR